MAGRKTALLALELSAEVERRMLARGVPESRLPPREATFAACWPWAVRERKAIRNAAKVRAYADAADRHAALRRDASEAAVDAIARMLAQIAGEELRRLVDFDPADWHLALRPGAAPADDRRAA